MKLSIKLRGGGPAEACLPSISIDHHADVGSDVSDARKVTMMTLTRHLRRLTTLRDQLIAEMGALQNRIAGLELAIALISEEDDRAEPLGAGKVHVTDTIVTLLREAGQSGLNPRSVIDIAAERGVYLNRGSVYATLNRLERAGTVVHEHHLYKLGNLVGDADPTAGFIAMKSAATVNKH
jgi:hypothetical protein